MQFKNTLPILFNILFFLMLTFIFSFFVCLLLTVPEPFKGTTKALLKPLCDELHWAICHIYFSLSEPHIQSISSSSLPSQPPTCYPGAFFGHHFLKSLCLLPVLDPLFPGFHGFFFLGLQTHFCGAHSLEIPEKRHTEGRFVETFLVCLKIT